MKEKIKKEKDMCLVVWYKVHVFFLMLYQLCKSYRLPLIFFL